MVIKGEVGWQCSGLNISYLYDNSQQKNGSISFINNSPFLLNPTVVSIIPQGINQFIPHFFCGLLLPFNPQVVCRIIMKTSLVIKATRVFLEESLQTTPLSVKFAVAAQIVVCEGLQWRQDCCRWDLAADVRLPWESSRKLEIEILKSSRKGPGAVVGESAIELSVLGRHLQEQVKLPLTYDGLAVGWLYCLASWQGQPPPPDAKFLYIHKLSLVFHRDEQGEAVIRVLQNAVPVFQKIFTLDKRTKTIYPNIKQGVRLSDVLQVTLQLGDSQRHSMPFLVDHVKRGKTAFFESWLRNEHKGKAGELSLEYFLENVYFENERIVFSRKGLIPQSLEARRSVGARPSIAMAKEIEQADKRMQLMNQNLNKWLQQVKENERMIPGLRKALSRKKKTNSRRPSRIA